MASFFLVRLNIPWRYGFPIPISIWNCNSPLSTNKHIQKSPKSIFPLGKSLLVPIYSSCSLDLLHKPPLESHLEFLLLSLGLHPMASSYLLLSPVRGVCPPSLPKTERSHFLKRLFILNFFFLILSFHVTYSLCWNSRLENNFPQNFKSFTFSLF